MGLSSEALDTLEAQIPELGRVATQAAFWNTLAAGQSALIAENGALYEVFPDGTRRYVKPLPPELKLPSGTTFTIAADQKP